MNGRRKNQERSEDKQNDKKNVIGTVHPSEVQIFPTNWPKHVTIMCL